MKYVINSETDSHYARPNAWNSFPLDRQELTNTDNFEKQLKSHLLISSPMNDI